MSNPLIYEDFGNGPEVTDFTHLEFACPILQADAEKLYKIRVWAPHCKKFSTRYLDQLEFQVMMEGNCLTPDQHKKVDNIINRFHINAFHAKRTP
jgi:hypothetical protein